VAEPTCYDGNGNMKTSSGGGYRSIAYTSFNLPSSSATAQDPNPGLQGPAGGAKYSWQYDEGHQRIKEVRERGGSTRTTWMLHPDNEGGLAFESEQNGAVVSNRHYLSVGGASFGVLVSNGALPGLAAGQTAPAALAGIALSKVEYWHQDNLGSLVATTDHNGAVTARYAYDPFGKRRATDGNADVGSKLQYDWNATNSGGDRGYTGHEQLDDVGVVHMNGRLYDPAIARFMQADPLVGDPGDAQSYNRYSYVLNDPMNRFDPSGYMPKATQPIDAATPPPVIPVPAPDRSGAAADPGWRHFSFERGCSCWTFVTIANGADGRPARVESTARRSEPANSAWRVAANVRNSANSGNFTPRLSDYTENGFIGLGINTAKAVGTTSVNFLTFIGGGIAGDSEMAAAGWNALVNTDRDATIGTVMIGAGGLVGLRKGAAAETSTVRSVAADVDYSKIPNPPNVGAGKDFTLRQKQEALAANRAANGGVVKSDLSGITLVQPQKSQRGVTPNPNEWQFDHRNAKNCGGTNCSSNIQILSRQENRLKSDD
jgi:RHS repeat-associated protein